MCTGAFGLNIPLKKDGYRGRFSLKCCKCETIHRVKFTQKDGIVKYRSKYLLSHDNQGELPIDPCTEDTITDIAKFLVERLGSEEALLKALTNERARMKASGLINEIDTPFGKLELIIHPLFKEKVDD